jgi:UPF0755 protein
MIMITKTVQQLVKLEIKTILGIFLCGVVVLVIGLIRINTPPRDFDSETIVTIPIGTNGRAVMQRLEDVNIIRSAQFGLLIATLQGSANTLVAGEYQFTNQIPTTKVVQRIAQGEFGISRTKVTLLEGWNNQEFAHELATRLPEFNEEEFLADLRVVQGTMFPDTYFFKHTDTTDTVIQTIQNNFTKRTQQLPEAIGRARSRSLTEIIIMASILEREAVNVPDAHIISDILWSRIDAGMPLQVDATLKYATGRGSHELTLTDLRTDGPWNTYTRRGLPPGAIGNPGIDMIIAALTPKENDYVYYLHDNNGTPYYARTHAEHVQNKQRYLR